jgi:hypothetical protein
LYAYSVPPLIFVGIGLGTSLDEYGVVNEDTGELE